MGNMMYCRFRNTVSDLEDCLEHIGDEDLSDEENVARSTLVMLCEDLIGEYERYVGDRN